MDYLDYFRNEKRLIDELGESKAYLVWVMSLYLDESNLEELTDNNLTDDSDDKKIDFIRLDLNKRKLIFVQGYYSKSHKDNAPANKASDLNTAAAWLTTGELKKMPNMLQDIIKSSREAINNSEIDTIELLYVHNCGESVPVENELKTVKDYLQKALNDKIISVSYKEIGYRETARMYKDQSSNITILDKVVCPSKIQYIEKGQRWKAGILTISGDWLRQIYNQYKDELFSANYRGFLGITKKRINLGIKNTAEKAPEQFWAFNNGVTILTSKMIVKEKSTELQGISIINGAQTSGAIGSLDLGVNLENVKILARIIECEDASLIADIVKYNNTQNKISSWDRFSNHPYQQEINKEFKSYNHSYSFKRGFKNMDSELGVENSIQPLVAFLGNFNDANRGRNSLFESDTAYKLAYDHVKARHILFVHCLNKCVYNIRLQNKIKIKGAGPISVTDQQVWDLFSTLKSKYFVVAAIGEILTLLYTDLKDKKEISFTPDYADNTKHSINELVVLMQPLLSSLINHIASYFRGKKLQDYLRDEKLLINVGTHVEMIISSVVLSLPEYQSIIDDFKKMVCNG